jgi:hypothetical protein
MSVYEKHILTPPLFVLTTERLGMREPWNRVHASEQGPVFSLRAPLLVKLRPGEGCDDRQGQEGLEAFLLL